MKNDEIMTIGLLGSVGANLAQAVSIAGLRRDVGHLRRARGEEAQRADALGLELDEQRAARHAAERALAMTRAELEQERTAAAVVRDERDTLAADLATAIRRRVALEAELSEERKKHRNRDEALSETPPAIGGGVANDGGNS